MIKKLSIVHIFIWVLIICGSCSENERDSEVYRIALEPSWHKLNLGKNERNVRAFTKELLGAISRIENIPIETVYTLHENSFISGLESREYDAIISISSPEGRGSSRFTFSKNYLPLGPLLVVREGEEFDSLDNMDGKIVGIPRDSSIVYDVKINPSIVIRYYNNINEAIEHLVDHDVDGIILGVFAAYGFTQNLYKGRLVVQESYLNDAGLRLLTLKGGVKEEFINRFDKALSILKENGEFAALIKKWKIPYFDSPIKDSDNEAELELN